ncbi:radiation-inducible immediate-early gene IEX-1-like [Scyliorhinus canicula]|uniref:radiation-inducible immediate-early gene IEX-1-like n=1 Tax=Scyliorhinus canicula TaxID=7830 RepID=UPI0018F7B15C|nr:radiation-inducible immediate-early gene IEX-1-like [Scyliorhinus canicula]
MEVIYTTSAVHFNQSCQLSQRAGSDSQPMSFPSRKSKMPQVFTFEPIRQSVKPKRHKRRHLKILYPPGQVRKSLPTEKDMTKRLLLFFLSIVLFQVYTTATEDELSLLATPEPSAGEQVATSSTHSPQPPAPSAVLSVVFLPATPGAENNCSQRLLAVAHLRPVRSCKL